MTEAMVHTGQPLWTNIRASFVRILQLCDEAQARQEQYEAKQKELNPLTGEMGAENTLEEHTALDGVDMVSLRASLRKLLDGLRKELSQGLSEREVYFALFPMVIYIDEIVQMRFQSLASPWQPLQRELYKIDNGGERFYDGIDNLLSKSDTHSMIFEVFYFCLVHGFRGHYVNDPEKVKFYRSVLTQRIPTRDLVRGASFGQQSQRRYARRSSDSRIHLVPFPKRLYAAAFGTGILGLVCAYLASSLELHLW